MHIASAKQEDRERNSVTVGGASSGGSQSGFFQKYQRFLSRNLGADNKKTKTKESGASAIGLGWGCGLQARLGALCC